MALEVAVLLAIESAERGGYGNCSRNSARSAKLEFGLWRRTPLLASHGYVTPPNVASAAPTWFAVKTQPSLRYTQLSPLQIPTLPKPGSGEGALVLPAPFAEAMMTAGAAAAIASGSATDNRKGMRSFIGERWPGSGERNTPPAGISSARAAHLLILVIFDPWIPSPAISPFWLKMKA